MTISDRPDDGALVTAVAIIRDMVRLSEMGFEQSLLEPDEKGNYATFERAKAFLASTPATGANTAQVASAPDQTAGALNPDMAGAYDSAVRNGIIAPDRAGVDVERLTSVLKPIIDELGFAEWASPDHAEEILWDIIKKYHARGRAALFATPSREGGVT